MYKKQILFAFMFIIVITGAFLYILRNTNTPVQIESQTKIIPPVEAMQASKKTADDIKVKASLANKQKPAVTAKQTDLYGLDDEVVNYYYQRADYMLDNPVHPGRAKLQQQMRNETPEETFHNLVDNDNFAMLMPVMGGYPFSPGVYESDVMIVTKMTRMRKLLADAKDNPYEVANFLERQLLILAKDFASRYKEYWENYTEDNRHSRELPEYIKIRILCTAAVYVLSQIGESNSFATLAQLANQDTSSSPVSRKFLFYAMHSLVRKYPRLDHSNGYLEKAQEYNIPHAKQIEATNWNAHYHEDDFRKMLPDNKIDLNVQPTMKLEQFPSLKHLDGGEVDSLLKELTKFY